MTNWNLYETRITIDGNTEKEIQINSIQSSVLDNFFNSPSFVEALRNGVQQEFNILEESVLATNANKKKAICKPNEYIVVGDTIEFDNSNWICTESDSNLGLYDVGIISRCTSTLKFYPSSQSDPNQLSDLIEIPCIVGKGNIGLDVNKFMSLPADENIVQCANTVDSLNIDENTRFILGRSVYKVLGISDIDVPGLLTIRVKEDQENADDNMDMGIANYFSHQVIYEMIILNSYYSSLNKDGDQLQILTECKQNGIVVLNPLNITYSSSDLTVCTVSNTGIVSTLGKTGLCTITATYKGISKSISVNVVSNIVKNYTVSINGNDLNYGMQDTYNAVFANSGSPFDLNTNWSLKADDGISSTGLASIISTNGIYHENCVVKSNSINISDIGKYVRLYASSVTPSISNYKRIKIVSSI